MRDYNITEEQNKLIAMSSDEFEKYMVEKYPDFFSNIDKSIQESCMAWGICIGKGWRPLLKELCDKITLICKCTPITIKFDQIKTKFGSGRFYYSEYCLGDDESKEYNLASSIISDLVSDYEYRSEKICDETGAIIRNKD